MKVREKYFSTFTPSYELNNAAYAGNTKILHMPHHIMLKVFTERRGLMKRKSEAVICGAAAVLIVVTAILI